MNRLAIVTVVICVLILSGCADAESPPEPIATTLPNQQQLHVHFIDVGQGDAILVDLGDTEVLIDGGGKSPGIVGYLRHYIDGDLEVMVATHPHADHIGGLIAVLDAFRVEQIWHCQGI